MLRTTVQNSKTFLRPQLQLFAEPAPQENPDKNPNNQIPPPADPPGGGTEPNLPKTQEELDALINTRLKRAEKDWLKKQKQAQQPPAAPPSASHAEGEGEPAEDNRRCPPSGDCRNPRAACRIQGGCKTRSSGGRSAACHACCRKIGG